MAELPSLAETVGTINRNPKKSPGSPISRRNFLRVAGVGAVGLAAAGLVGYHQSKSGEKEVPVDPTTFNPEKGVLNSQNTIVKPTQEALAFIKQQTQADQKLRFAPPAEAQTVEYRHVEVPGSNLEYIEWNGFPEGAVIKSPYSGRLKMQTYKGVDANGNRYQDAKQDYDILDIELRDEYNAKATWQGVPVFRFMIPATVETSIPRDTFEFEGEGSTYHSKNVVEIVAGQPLFTIGSNLLHIYHGGEGKDRPRQFHTYFNEIAVESTKAVVLANS